LLEKTKQDYNLVINDFSRANHKIWPELFTIFNNYIKNKDEILDIGCGIGRLLEIITGEINYTGIDNSEGQLQRARGRHQGRNFLLAEATNLPFEKDSFDKVFLISLLHHLPGRELRVKTIKEAYRVLKPNGLLLLSVWRPKSFIVVKSILKYSFLKAIGKSQFDWFDVIIPWAGGGTARYYHLFKLAELIGLIKNQGFKIIESGVVKSESGKRANLYVIAQKVLMA